MFPKVHNLNNKEIVVGSTLPALIFAQQNDLPLVSGFLEKPQPFERFEPDLDLGEIGLYFPNELLETPDSEIDFGPRKLDLWNWFWFELGLKGLLPGGELNKQVQIEDKNLIVRTTTGKKIVFEYDRLHLFSDQGVRGIPNDLAQSVDNIIVYDYFDVKKNSTVPFDLINMEDDFVSEIWFISTDRFLREKIKDLVAVSYLNENQIDNFAYGEVSVRYKVLEILKNSSYNKRLKLEHKRREVLKTRRNVYYNTDKITFHNVLEEELLCPDYFTSQE
jgi:hypothetical protein